MQTIKGMDILKLREAMGRNLADLRKTNGVNQSELAKVLGISRVQLVHIEHGRAGLSPDKILICSLLFRCRMEDIFPSSREMGLNVEYLSQVGEAPKIKMKRKRLEHFRGKVARLEKELGINEN